MVSMRLRATARAVAVVGLLIGLTACTSGEHPTLANMGGKAQGAAAGGIKPPTGVPVTPRTGKTLKIGVSIKELDQFLQKVGDGMTARAAQNGVSLNLVSAQAKTETQLGQVENFIAQHVDGIIVVPVDTDATAPITEAATEAKIPLVYVNTRPSNLPAGVPYVGSDSLVSGTMEMEYLAKLLGGKGNVAVIMGDPASEAAILRTKGCKDVVAKYPGMAVVKEATGSWSRDKALGIMENWIQSGTRIDAVCSNNDEMALGAIEALKAANRLSTTAVGGVDATGDALTAMAGGDLKVTVFQDAVGQGAGAVDTIVHMANGDQVQNVIDIPFELVSPDNYLQYQGR